MAEALLGIVIENLRPFVDDKLATFWGVDQHIEKLYSNLTAIQAVLKDAERKQITRHAVKDWLQKLTDAAYVLDDILDQCSIHSNKVQRDAQSSCLVRFHPKDIQFRCQIGKRMKDITQRFHDIHEERCMFELRTGVTEKQAEDDYEWRQTSSVITEPVIYGRDQDREKIVEFLVGHATNNEDLSIYSIVGMGGLGKTALAKQVFNDDRVRKHFDLTIWVCVSDDFNMKRILQSVVEFNSEQNPNLKTLEQMQRQVQKVLQSKRYLLVLDDVWNEDLEKWKELKGMLQSARGTKGATVLVTTQLEQVASIMETHPAHRLIELSEDDSWSLFKHHAFGPKTEESAELVAMGKEIVKKCVGSPLAIKTLGSLLHNESEVRQWQNVLESEIWEIKEETSLTSKENSIMRVLKLSYVNLELSLKRCFSFCAIFPKDSEIDKEELIYFWMANGYIKSEGSLEVEDVGNKVWEKLYRRSFFQEAKSDEFGIMTSFKMHDLFHDLATFIMDEECKVSGDKRLTHLSRRVHHLHLLESTEAVNITSFKKVESLRTFLHVDSDIIRESFLPLPSKSCLRALQTSSGQLSAVAEFTHLRYLNLCDSFLTRLPNSICGLHKLQILKLEDCDELYWLPKDLTRLQDLRHLVIKGCPSIAEMPPNIGKLSHLGTLSTFIVGSNAGHGLAELHGLKLGGKLHIKGLEKAHNERDAKQANLISKKDLNRLYFSWGRGVKSEGGDVNAERVMEALEPPSTLKSFGIRRYQGIQLPSWMINLSVLKDLVEVILYDCENCEQLPPLGKLPHLKRLFVSGMKNVKHIDGDSYDGAEEKAFPSLERLTLEKLPNLERILRDEGVEILPCLSQLRIVGIPNLKLPRLPSMENLFASDVEDAASFMEVVGNMPCLKALRITHFSKLKVLANQPSRLGALEVLEIQKCDELEEIVLQGLTCLRTLLILECKKLKSLSEGVGDLVCLEYIYVYKCPELVALPSNMNKLTCLRTLSISQCNKLKSLSEGVGDIVCLEYIYVNKCPELVALPSNMNKLTSLRVVTIGGCSMLPEGLQRIPSLQTLSIHECTSTSLPDWLGDMTSLRELSIYNCPELRSIPSSFQHLTNLAKLSIAGCPELEKRCKRETGQDWQYIAHIPQVDIPEKLNCQTICELIRVVRTGVKRIGGIRSTVLYIWSLACRGDEVNDTWEDEFGWWLITE